MGVQVLTHRTDVNQTHTDFSTQVLVGARYGTSADMWSLACMVFELLTGDLLFNPRAGENYERDEDHLALMIELLGASVRTYWTGWMGGIDLTCDRIAHLYVPHHHTATGKYPKKLCTGGKRSRDFFNRKGELKHIQGLKFWGLEDVLAEKYRLARPDAAAAAAFLLPILDFDPARRATAQDCLAHPWLFAGDRAVVVGAAEGGVVEAEGEGEKDGEK